MKPTYTDLYEFVLSLAKDEPRNVEPEVDDIIARATAVITKEVDVYVIVEGGVVQSIRSANFGLVAQVVDLDNMAVEKYPDRLAEAYLEFSRTLPAIW